MLRFSDISTDKAVLRGVGSVVVLCSAMGLVHAQDTISVPSGQKVTFHEEIVDSDGQVVRFRFVAPAIARDGGEIGFAEAEPDIIHLCEHYALPRLADMMPIPAQIIISLSDRPVEFGYRDSQATQFFEAFTSENGLCVWEGL